MLKGLFTSILANSPVKLNWISCSQILYDKTDKAGKFEKFEERRAYGFKQFYWRL